MPLPKPVFGGNCLQPIEWHKETLDPATATSYTLDGDDAITYTAHPPEPKAGHWTGYFIEVAFESQFRGELLFTTTGHAWPNTLPFEDCHADECQPILV